MKQIKKPNLAPSLLKKYGDDYFVELGKKGGKAKVKKGFGAATPEQRKAWGKLGGSRKKTKGAKNGEETKNNT